MIVIKIGGSVITDKSKKNHFKQNVMKRLAYEIKKSKKDIVLVHGAGSFGHILAKKHNLNEGYQKNHQLMGFSETHAMVQQLNSLVLKELHNASIPAVSLPPHSFLKLDDHDPIESDFLMIKEYLKLGFTPVTFGDVVLDRKLGFSICSGDLLLQMLSEFLKPEKVIFVIDEDGLYTSNPKIDKTAEFIKKSNIDDLEKLTTKPNSHDDVTKGMQGKIDTIQNIVKSGIDTILLNGNVNNRLYYTLMGQNTKYTLIHGGKK